MEIKKEYGGKELTLFIEGRIDTVTANDLEEEIIIETGDFDSLILDFKNVDYISSAGLRVLISTEKKLEPKNIPLIIKNLNYANKEIFRISGFDKILKIE